MKENAEAEFCPSINQPVLPPAPALYPPFTTADQSAAYLHLVRLTCDRRPPQAHISAPPDRVIYGLPSN